MFFKFKFISVVLIVAVLFLFNDKKIFAVPQPPSLNPGTCTCAPIFCAVVPLVGNNCNQGFEPKCGDQPLCTCSCVMISTTEPPPSQPSPPPPRTTDPVTTFCEEEGFGPGDEVPKVRTALGCVPVTINGFVEWFIPILFGIAGGIAFLIMVFGFINLAVSGDDPTKVQGAKDTIISAISGLVLIIFALFILRLILLVIFKIPGII